MSKEHKEDDGGDDSSVLLGASHVISILNSVILLPNWEVDVFICMFQTRKLNLREVK